MAKENVMAVHKETGEIFVGKRTQTGYSKEQYLKSALTYASKKKEDYLFVSMSFESIGDNLAPKLTVLNENKEENENE